MHQMNTKQQISPLLTGHIDLGIMRNTVLPDNLHHQLLFRELLFWQFMKGILYLNTKKQA